MSLYKKVMHFKKRSGIFGPPCIILSEIISCSVCAVCEKMQIYWNSGGYVKHAASLASAIVLRLAVVTKRKETPDDTLMISPVHSTCVGLTDRCTYSRIRRKSHKNSESFVLQDQARSVLHRAGLTIVPAVPWERAPAARGPPWSTAKFLPRCFDVWTYVQKRHVYNDD